MNATFLLSTLMGLCLALSCTDRKTTTSDSASNGGTQGQGGERVTLGGKAKGDSLVFSLERTPCFGTCKAYRLNVYRSGYGTYEGRAHVEKEGMHSARIGTDTLAALVREAERIGFFDLDARYDSPVTDLPSIIIRVVANGRDHQVVGRVGTPAKFKAFAEYAEELLLPVAWKPMQPEQ